jgi:hypothetical protein
MDPRNLDARDLASEAEAVFEQLEVAPPAVPPAASGLPSTREELVALIQQTVYTTIANSPQIQAFLAAVPRGEA